MKKLGVLWSLVVLAAGSALAQETPRFTGSIGGGFTTPTEAAGDRLDRGWNVGAGVGFNFNSNVALTTDFTYHSFGINAPTLTALGFPGGDVRIWSATLNPVVHTNPRGPVDVYFTGGGGLYQWNQEFTRPGTATYTGFDPYLGIFYPVAVPVNVVVSSYTVNKPGFNGGMGLSFGSKRGKVFAEARFQRIIFGNNRYVDMIPATFGFRW